MSPRLPALALACVGAATACAPSDGDVSSAPSDLTSDAGGGAASSDGDGERDELVLGTYNLEFFGSPTAAPRDDELQVQNASAVIARLDPDILGLQEIVDDARFEQLSASLPGYEGLLVSDPAVEGGAAAYATVPLRLAVLYRGANVTLLRAKALPGIDPGRWPLEVTFSVRTAGVTYDLVFIVVHFYPFGQPASHARREESGARLKQYLDANHPSDKLAVVGDWNDDVDTSIVQGYPTPYAPFVDDAERYRFTTSGLSVARQGTYIGYPATIDHHLASDELAAFFVPRSAWVERPRFIERYADTTSDHYPVITRYAGLR